MSLREALAADWERLTGEPPGRDGLQLMKVSSRPGLNLPLLFFLFRDGADRPEYALKVNRNPDYPDAILREFANYSVIWGRGGGEGFGMPRPVFCERVGGHVVLCETYVAGRRCEDRFFSVRRGGGRRRVIERFLTAAMAWIRDFHHRTRGERRVFDAGRIEEELVRPLRIFAERADVPARLAERLTVFSGRLQRLGGEGWPVTAVHGDFDHGNILLDGDRIGVVDWEDCEVAGNPFVDLAYLVFHLALVSDLELDRSRRLDAFFSPGGWSHGLATSLLRDYATAHGLAPDLFFLALPGTVVHLLTRAWGVERDPRSIPICSLDMLEYVVELSLRETEAAA